MKKGVMAPEKLVDINNLPLKEIKKQTGSLHIGALALNSDVSEHKLVTQYHPLLSLALKVRCIGTIKKHGNCWGKYDATYTVLLLLRAFIAMQ